MCEAATIIGGLLTAGSMAANSAAQNQSDAARSKVLEQNRARQAELQGQADALNQKSQKSYDGFDANQKAKAGDLASYFTDGAGPAVAQGAGQPTETAPGSTSNIVQTEQAKQSGKAKAYTDQQGAALGNLRSFGDTLGGLDRSQARDAGALGQIGNFMQGNTGVTAYELEAANHAGDGLRAIGDVAKLGGNIGLGYGLSKNVAGAAPAAGAAAPASALGSTFSSIPSLFGATLPKVY